MNDSLDSLESLLREHEELQFPAFTHNTAFEIGTAIKKEAEIRRLPVAIDVTRQGHQLFHCALEGTSADNDRWILRKNNVTNHFGKSSFYIKNLLLENGQTLEEPFCLPHRDFAPYGGSFPIIIKGTGPIGTITVSGLPDEEDHKLVTEAIRTYLKGLHS